MKSPLYLLTALLPLTLAIPSADAEVENESLEERSNGNNCRSSQSIPYYRYPCDSSDKLGSYQSNKNVDYICKYKWGIPILLVYKGDIFTKPNRGWYKTGNNWWVKENYRPRGCSMFFLPRRMVSLRIDNAIGKGNKSCWWGWILSVRMWEMKKATFLCALMETCKTISILSNVVSPSEFEENLLAAQMPKVFGMYLRICVGFEWL
jgi:hypothetical protein